MAKIIPLNSRQRFGRTRPPGGEADVLYPKEFDLPMDPEPDFQERQGPARRIVGPDERREILRTIGMGSGGKQFYINAVSIQTGRKSRLDGPYPSKVAAEAAKRRLELEASGDLMLSVEPG